MLTEKWRQGHRCRSIRLARRYAVCPSIVGPRHASEQHSTSKIKIENREGEYYLGLIEILPEYQGHGVGTAVIQDFLAAAQAHNLPATLHVLKSNDPARKLYERLGFTIVAEEKHKYKMKNEER